MKKEYKNQLLLITQEEGINPKLFTLEEENLYDLEVCVIKLSNTPLTFEFRNSYHTPYEISWRFTYFTPDFPMSVFSRWETPTNLYRAFQNWIGNEVKPYIEEQVEPDLWERIALQLALGTGAESISEDTDVFSNDEKVRLRILIEKFRLQVVITFGPSSDELKVIDERFEHLTNSVDLLNKLYWRGLTISTLISISTTLILDNEKVKLLVDLFKLVFSEMPWLIQ